MTGCLSGKVTSIWMDCSDFASLIKTLCTILQQHNTTKNNRQTMKKIILLLTIAFGLTTLSNAQTKEIKPKGNFKEIDVTRHNEAIEILNGKNRNITGEYYNFRFVNDFLTFA